MLKSQRRGSHFNIEKGHRGKGKGDDPPRKVTKKLKDSRPAFSAQAPDG